MSGDDYPRLIASVVILAMLVASLGARQLPMREVLRNTLLWIALAAIITLLILLAQGMGLLP